MRTRSSRRFRRSSAAVAALALLVAACDGGDTDPDTDPDTAATEDQASDRELAVAVASYDLAVGDDQRLMAGIFTPEQQLLAFGEVDFELGFLGEEAGGAAELRDPVSARYLPVPGMEPEAESTDPTFLEGRDSAGVYVAQVAFDEAGYWGLRVVAELADGSTYEGQTTFLVQEEHEVLTAGEEAPATENLTLADVEAGEAEPAMLDSRAEGQDEVPDPHLHRTTIADAIEAGRPAVVAFSTPVYCVSRFCGPLTETLADLAGRYEDRADFIMVEVWRDFQAQELNEAAAEWIQTTEGGNEPWVFLVGEDGRIVQRWDNVLDVAELESSLEELPAIAPGNEDGPDEGPDAA